MSSSTTFTVGTQGTFPVTTTGFSTPPTLTETGRAALGLPDVDDHADARHGQAALRERRGQDDPAASGDDQDTPEVEEGTTGNDTINNNGLVVGPERGRGGIALEGCR